MEKGSAKVMICILAIIVIVAGCILGYKIVKDRENQKEIGTIAEENGAAEKELEQKQVKIYQGDERPIAVMYDNHNQAWPQVGLNQAYLVYEAIAEGK